MVAAGSEYPDDWEERREKVIRRDGGGCFACGATPEELGDGLHVHHITPLSDGGSNNYDNLLTLCPSCHSDIHAGETSLEGALPHEDAGPIFVDLMFGSRVRLRERGEKAVLVDVETGKGSPYPPEQVDAMLDSGRLVLDALAPPEA